MPTLATMQANPVFYGLDPQCDCPAHQRRRDHGSDWCILCLDVAALLDEPDAEHHRCDCFCHSDCEHAGI